MAPVSGASKSKDESPSTEAQTIFEHIDAQSATIADTAFKLGEIARNPVERESHIEGLDILREDINKIGSELRSVEAKRDSLSEWEAKALDQIVPLMNDAASNTEKAIDTFDTTPGGFFWSGSYVDDTAKVFKDADKVSTILHDYLKLEKAHEKELRLERRLGEQSGS